jgi:hypothetical protein
MSRPGRATRWIDSAFENIVKPTLAGCRFFIEDIKKQQTEHPSLDPWNSVERSYDKILNEYYDSSLEPIRNCPFKLGILTEFQNHHQNYITACQEMQIDYAVIDFSRSDWLENIQHENCDGLLVHPSHWLNPWKQLFDERISIIENVLQIPTTPLSHEIWLYESKRRQTYWMQARNIKHPRSYVFYTFKNAEEELKKINYPVVCKTNLGSAGSGVWLISSYEEAVHMAKTAIGSGLRRNPGDPRDVEWGYVLFQEFIPKATEFRVEQIGNSWFSHEKVAHDNTYKHSGSGLVRWTPAPESILEMCYRISRLGNFQTMCYDVLVSSEGVAYVNELQTVFGSYDPAQMYIDDVPCRMLRDEKGWKLEKGVFMRNGGANLRIRHFLEQLEQKKV